MAGVQARKIWEKLMSPFKQVDKRRLQHELDTHRLFLLTSYNRLGASGAEGEEVAKEIQDLANNTSYSTQQTEVQSYVHQQIAVVAEWLDSVLVKKPPESEAPVTRARPLGLSFAVGGIPQVNREKMVETYPLSRVEVSQAFHERFGFMLEVGPSGIPHEEAGEGLFLRGRVEPGRVVSFYPGVIYAPSQYRYMQGYPRVDTDNPYLISRYDGLILDGKVWGRGGEKREWWDGSIHNKTHDSSIDAITSVGRSPHLSEQAERRHALWESVAGAQRQQIPVEGSIIERRNPLAYGHFANHPPKDIKPNVMICSYSALATNGLIRPYIPNVVLEGEEQHMERQGLLWVKEGRSDSEYSDTKRNAEIHTLVLVATRTLEDEELLLNYRLSSYIKRPIWYHAVDEEEDKRRWD